MAHNLEVTILFAIEHARKGTDMTTAQIPAIIFILAAAGVTVGGVAMVPAGLAVLALAHVA